MRFLNPDEQEALRYYARGEAWKCSTDIAEQLSYGYGTLDQWGFWEFPLPFTPDLEHQLEVMAESREIDS